jgi:hypothetical protein
MSKVNKQQLTNIADKSEQLGDKAQEEFTNSGNIEAGKLAINAFKNTLYANSLLITADKLSL